MADSALRRLGDHAQSARGPGPVSVRAYRALLRRILELGGPADVLLAGIRFDRLHESQLFVVLLNSDSVEVLLNKLTRLNRYFHSLHRQDVLSSTPRAVELRHVPVAGPGPEPVESLFVAGLYIVLLEEVGCVRLRLALPDSGSSGWVYEGANVSDVPIAGTSRWRFQWDDFEPRHPLPSIDDLLLLGPGPPETVSRQVASLVERDLARPWRVRDVAHELLMSPRTLQRRLQSEGTTLTRIVADLRIAHARELLVDSASSVTDVGYMLGYADTPHFTRAFSAAVGSPPSEWRGKEPAPG